MRCNVPVKRPRPVVPRSIVCTLYNVCSVFEDRAGVSAVGYNLDDCDEFDIKEEVFEALAWYQYQLHMSFIEIHELFPKIPISAAVTSD